MRSISFPLYAPELLQNLGCSLTQQLCYTTHCPPHSHLTSNYITDSGCGLLGYDAV